MTELRTKKLGGTKMVVMCALAHGSAIHLDELMNYSERISLVTELAVYDDFSS